MPTGYTAAIKDGISFEKFVWSCARAFGALIDMRDDPMDAPIPQAFEPSPYPAQRLQEARAELARLKGLTSSEISAAAAAVYQQAVKHHGEYIAEKTELRNKYNAILAKAVQWKPPTPEHEGLQKFMVDQIRQSIDFDCNTSYYTAPEKLDAAAWHAKAVAKAQKDVDYYEAEYAEEVKRTNGRNAWLKALRESVPPAP